MTKIIATKTLGVKYVTNKVFVVGDLLAKQLIEQGKAKLADSGEDEPAPKPKRTEAEA